MFHLVNRWFQRHLSDPQALLLLGFLLVSLVLVLVAGQLVGPLVTALILAYFLDWPVTRLVRWHWRRFWAVLLVFLSFIGVLLVFLLVLLPLLWEQSFKLVQELPSMLDKGKFLLLELPKSYPELISADKLAQLVNLISGEFVGISQHLVSYSWSSLIGLMNWAVYLVLIPSLVFILLKDKNALLTATASWLPQEHRLFHQVFDEVNQQMGNYVRGKVVEIFIVGAASYIAFSLMQLNYALLLAVLTGISVLVPVVGALVVTIPVCLVAYFQWGLLPNLGYLLLAHVLIQTLDGYLLSPLIFSESVDLHPLAIILSIWIFGNLWGFWGIFFAIPLATLIKAILHFWPSRTQVL